MIESISSGAKKRIFTKIIEDYEVAVTRFPFRKLIYEMPVNLGGSYAVQRRMQDVAPMTKWIGDRQFFTETMMTMPFMEPTRRQVAREWDAAKETIEGVMKSVATIGTTLAEAPLGVMIEELIRNPLTYDGKAFFADDHVGMNGEEVSNIVSGTGIDVEDIRKDILGWIDQVGTMQKRGSGMALLPNVTELIVIHPAKYRSRFIEAFQPLVAPATAQNALAEIKRELISTPLLTGDSYYVFGRDAIGVGLEPIMLTFHNDSKSSTFGDSPIRFTEMWENRGEENFMNLKIRYGVHAWFDVVPLFWQPAALVQN